MKLIAVGKTKEKFCVLAQEKYLKNIKIFTSFDLHFVKEEKRKNKLENINKEGERILQKISADDFVLVLDSSGKILSSEKLAEKIEFLQNESKNIVFVIGGTFGLSEDVLKRADFIWSLSNLTFTHEMARIILYEQIYRAFTILKNKKYHY